MKISVAPVQRRRQAIEIDPRAGAAGRHQCQPGDMVYRLLADLNHEKSAGRYEQRPGAAALGRLRIQHRLGIDPEGERVGLVVVGDRPAVDLAHADRRFLLVLAPGPIAVAGERLGDLGRQFLAAFDPVSMPSELSAIMPK
jgi:hypothetical protein